MAGEWSSAGQVRGVESGMLMIVSAAKRSSYELFS
jgi:hypothetical protein